jgi:hypothetical protein
VQTKDTITIYWAPSKFVLSGISWSQLYTDPVPLITEHKKNPENKTKGDSIFKCPAHTDTNKNVFVFKSNLDDEFDFPQSIFQLSPHYKEEDYPKNYRAVGNKLTFDLQRISSYEDYVNITYNMGWLFLATEPVMAKFTAPYYPPTSPAEGALLANGEFDIGKWFRPYNLDYHIPNGTKKISFKENQHLFYLHLETDKKIIFKRFILTSELYNLSNESSMVARHYGLVHGLTQRYEAAKKSKIIEQARHLIEKNTFN